MHRILLIEDDQMLRRALRIALVKSGYEVVEAGNGHEGLMAFKAKPVDLVVTDLIMPEMEGVETIQVLRKLSPYLPIIAISGGGRGSPADYLHFAQKLGAARAFAKPFEPGELCAAVGSLLGENDRGANAPTAGG